MKKLILVCTLFFAASMANAQAWSGKGDQKIQVGLSGLGYGTGVVGTYDYGLSKIISLGVGANIFFDHNNNKYQDDDFAVFGRLNFHLQQPLGLPSKWDIYPGIDLGVLGKNGTYIGAHIGARYYFNQNIGIYLEAGNNGSIGVSFNL
ncbi:DUF6646 family protein [Halpernia frigidisoli]|uniref:Outer membrane protein beta-barrel domain-containing protein n=1 Tax=Halpernia frigidisoli TaxID=1125876 RepID=A0A1I3HRJ8_9FLAO|nr:DUF6646 family protein [Halpernia frigidisoli]SFI38140.1 hypothetical protein SAMN05443292_2348 [Halpernia frigidisoli]